MYFYDKFIKLLIYHENACLPPPTLNQQKESGDDPSENFGSFIHCQILEK
jgi:hypothetical protein